MAGDSVGTIRTLTLKGQLFRAPADIDIEMNLSPFETEAMPTTGKTLYKMTIKSTDFNGITLSTNADEGEDLKELAKSLDDFSMSVGMADGREYKAQGRINFENRTSSEGKATVKLMPNNALKGWQLF